MNTGLATLFLAASISHHLPPKLLESLCYVESRHNVDAIHQDDGGGDSLGICQVKQFTCEDFGIDGGNLFDPKSNIECAATYLQYQINRYHNIKRGVCAYNRGKSTGDGNNRYTKKVYQEWKKRLHEKS